ncbi:hypothetical protein [Acidovorax sacchari]|uniref:hypothetical protein n=1 Tax=Acidovorax sacchari TaxID=3230736 RepID=UPI0039E35E95
MATWIPALGECAARRAPGGRRLAELLEQKLEDDYLLWWDILIRPKQMRPAFVVLHLRRCTLKGGRLETIRTVARERIEIVPDCKLKVVMIPLQQVCRCVINVFKALERARVAQIRCAYSGFSRRKFAAALRQCAKHLLLHAEKLQVGDCRHPGAGLINHSDDLFLLPPAGRRLATSSNLQCKERRLRLMLQFLSCGEI